LFISVTPHRLSQHSQDVWLEVWIDQSVPLMVGRVLRFEEETPFFGVISDLFEEDRTGSWLVRVSIILGQPSLQSQFATMLSERDVQRLIQQHKPAHHGVFSLSDGERGTLTILDLPRQPLHRQILGDFAQAVFSAHPHVICIDPEGDWAKLPVDSHMSAPEAFKLSIQEMGVPAFLELVGQEIPQPLQPDAFRILSRQVPATPDFIPLLQFLRPERIPELPVKAVLLHVLYRIYQQNWFASHPDEVMAPQDWLSESATRLDLSALDDSAKSLFYQQSVKKLIQTLKSSPDLAEGLVVLLNQPERFLKGLLPSLSTLQSLGASVVVLPQAEHEGLLEMAQNHLTFQSDEGAIFEGVSTLGLPIPFVRKMPKLLAGHAGGVAEAESNLPMSEEEQAEHARHYSQFDFPGFSGPGFSDSPPAHKKSEPTKKYADPPVKPVEVSEKHDEVALDPEPIGLFNRGTEFKVAPDEDFWGDVPDSEKVENNLEMLHLLDQLNQEKLTEDPTQEREEPHHPAHEYYHSHPLGPVEPTEFESSRANDSHHDGHEDHLWETPSAEMLYGDNITDALSDNELTWDEGDGMELKVIEGLGPRPINHGVDDDVEEETPQVVFREEQILMSDEPYLMGGPIVENELVETPQERWQEPLSESPIPQYSPEPIAPIAPPLPSRAPTPQQQTVPVYKVLSDPMPFPDAQSQPGYKVGDRVKHEKYGFGSIHKVTPVDESVILHIIFDSVGKRLMDPTLTGITKL
jgi:hypothetical protein